MEADRRGSIIGQNDLITQSLNAMWGLGLDPGTGKGHRGKTGEIQIRSVN